MRHLLAFVSFLCIAFSGQAQTQQPLVHISGKVLLATDQKPLAGVTVVARPGRFANVTSVSGIFSIKAHPCDTLVFYSVGFTNER